MKTFVVLLVCSAVCTLAKPQYGAPQPAQPSSSYGGASGGGAPGGGAPGGGAPGGGAPGGGAPGGGAPAQPSSSYGGASGGGAPGGGAPGGGAPGGDAPGGGAPGGGSSDSGSAGGASGGLVTQCQMSGSDGKLKFVCEGVAKDSITLKSEHILWLNSAGGKQQVLDIEVPNYKIDELIKAGFKPSKDGDTKINVLLKKPEQSYEAQTDKPQTAPGQTKVQLQYEPPQPIHVHYPNDKPYQPLSGPILPPPKK